MVVEFDGVCGFVVCSLWWDDVLVDGDDDSIFEDQLRGGQFNSAPDKSPQFRLRCFYRMIVS